MIAPTLLVRHPPGRDLERAYVVDVVLRERLGLTCELRAEPRDDVEISLAGDPDGQRVTVADVLMRTPAERWLRESTLPEAPLATWTVDEDRLEAPLASAQLPVLFGRPGLEVTEDSVAVGLDVFGSVFFLLTRYEELARGDRDEYDRFPAAASLAVAAGFLDRPLVDEYVEVLWAVMRRTWPRLERRVAAGGLRLSCDVDWPFYTVRGLTGAARSATGDLVRRRDPATAAVRLRAWLGSRRGDLTLDPWHSFDFMMDEAERRGLRVAFYFMTGCTNPAFDGCYQIEDPRIRHLLRHIGVRGHEIGLHPSYETFRDRTAIAAESQALRSVCSDEGVAQERWGGRQHFLRWENPVTWRNWDAAGLGYDSTLGYPDVPGFRAGTCIEYPVFDLLARRRLALRERPLVAMERTVLGSPSTSDESVLASLDDLRRRCHAVGGDFTLLWHNTQLATRRLRRLYSAALDLA